jgi:hypothetical protein
MDFSNLSAQAVAPGKVVPLTLYQLTGDPVLHVCHLGESNAEFWNDAIAKANARSVGATKRASITAKVLREARDTNRVTVAKYAVKGLEGFKDRMGREGTLEHVELIIKALPDDVFDTVLAFCQNPDNFRDRPIEGDAEVIAGK